MNFKKYHVSKNLFDKDSQNWKVGYRVDDEGNEVSSQIAQYSQNRIEVSPSSTYTAFGFYPDGTSLSNSGFKLYCYDANDVWIENISASLNSPKEFTMPNNCHYIRIQVTTAYYAPNTAMINTGSTPQPYEPYGDTWHDIPYYQHSTATDTLPQLPSTIYPTNTYLNVELEGNSVQNGTPSLSSPVDVNGVGDESDVQTYIVNAHIDGVSIQKAFEHSELCQLTAPNKSTEYFNYWEDENNNILSYNRTFTQRIVMNRNIYATYSNVEVTPQPCLEMYLYNAIKDGGNNLYWLFFGEVPDNYSVVEEGIMYTANRTAGYTQDSTVDLTTVPGFDFDAVWADSSKYRVDKYTGTGNIFTQVFNLFIGDSVNNYFYGKGYITIKNNTTQEQSTIYSDMVKGTYNNTNLRPTPTTHYNIPITCSNITYNRYLSETESIRYIKKLVFDGTENWRQSVNGAMYLSPFTGESYKKEVAITSMNSHFAAQSNTTSGTNQVGDNSSCFLAASGSAEYYIGARSYATAANFKTYLAQQYAAGTPVTVWYVLSTPETSTINEPLMKIGNYTDKINTTIPTKGTTEITVNTTIQPSNISVDGFQNMEIGLKGNTVQNGTPTSDNPVMPNGTGERTANLFSSTWESGNINSTTGQNETSGTVCRTKDYIPVTPNTIYSMKRSIYTSYINVRFYRADKTYIGGGSSSTINIIVGSRASNPMLDGVEFCVFELIDTDIAYMRINDASNNVNTRYMMVEGQYTSSTMPTYEPYGYKIPISSNSTTTPVYLGEVQTVRKIIKYEFTGEENWIRESGNTYALEGVKQTATGYENALCTHYVLAKSYNTLTGTDGTFSVSRRPSLFIHDENFTTVAQLKTYLATQYAAGTPVTVWYVLANEETAVVNEPLMKIGDYADTLSNISIPVTAGGDTISVGTTIQPSEVTVNYKGWHPAQSVHEKSKNLFDKDAKNVDNGYITNGFLQSDGSITTNIDYRASEYIKISQNQQYALYYGSNLNFPSVCFYDSAKNYISGVAYAGRRNVPFITPQNAEYLRLSFRAVDPASIMLNTGNAPLPYEPYWK